MKKIIAVVLAILIFACFIYSRAWAGDMADGVYTVLFAGSTEHVGVFSPSQKPWLLIKYDDILHLDAISRWKDPSSNIFWSTDGFFHTGHPNKIWLSFSDSFWAGLTGKEGEWHIRAFETLNGNNLIGTAHFMVTPEPISSALFLLGGGALVLRTFRRKKA